MSEEWIVGKNNILTIKNNLKILTLNIQDFFSYTTLTNNITLTIENFKYWKKILIKYIESTKKYIKIIIIDDSVIELNDIYFQLKINNIDYDCQKDNKTLIITGIKKENEVVVKNNRIAVCTCIFNDYDKLSEIPDNIPDNVDFYCFTDNKNIVNPGGWIIDTYPYHYMDNDVEIEGRISIKNSIYSHYHWNIVAKYYKMCLSRIEILKNYSYFLYIDGSIRLKTLDFLKNYKDNNIEFLMFKHPEFTSIRQEYISGSKFNRYHKQPLKEQIEKYYDDGYPDMYVVCSGFYYRPNVEKYNNMFLTWYYEVQKWTDLCQISGPFCHWLYDLYPKINQDYLMNSEYTYFTQHKYNY